MDLDVIVPNSGVDFILDLDRYIPTLLELKDKHKKELDIKIGMEFGIQKHLGKIGDDLISKYPFDFVLSSVHSVDKLLVDQKEFWENKTRDEAHEKYFLEILKSLDAFNNYSVHGHVDFISRYGGIDKKGFIDYNRYRDLIDLILKRIIEKGKGIEINTSGIRYNENRFYPHNDIIKRYFDLGGEIITIGSDSHKASDLGKDFKLVYDFLESIGVNYISSFDQMVSSFKKIK